ncbi:MAG TPA: hypothetical protein VLH79_02820 [Chthonomonadales bacterium]|nr:hypothetical protein [Chthonomonadales bacterium]
MGSLPAPVQRWLTILLPPVVLIVSCLVMVPRNVRLRDAHKDIAANRVEIKAYLTKLAAIEGQPSDPKVATLPYTRQEQSDFLRGLNTLSNQTGNRMVSVASLAPPPQPARKASAKRDEKDAKKKGADELPEGVVAIPSTVVFEGDFRGLRAFLGGLQHSQRLISLDACRIEPLEDAAPMLRTTLSIVRYVDAPGGGTEAPQAPAAHAGESDGAPSAS